MVRKHGWQLPAHMLQIVAITVFFLLVVAFYAFFAPFLGSHIVEYVAIGIYTPVVFAVAILYIRCTSINPADPGIMSKFEGGFTDAPARTAADLEGTSLPEKVEANSPASTCRSCLNGRSNHASLAAGDSSINVSSQPQRRSSKSCLLGGLVCSLFIKEDCRKYDDSENQVDGEDVMFCTICNAEVRKFSKHCRNCDKCVDGFDHHCRWLNNCVGRKNYFTFIALMVTSLLWLVIEFGTGIAVLVICFTNKNSGTIIKGKIGSGLTLPPFATIVVFFTLLSLVACVPLCELFFFHMLLIRKGITTYEYVVAMRAMSEVPEEEDEEEGVNIVYSRTNSETTAFSGASSLGVVHHKGAWCTPPRIFVDQDEVIPHLEPGMVPSSVDPDAAAHGERASNKARKPVKISAWKLAKLDSNEAMKAAAKARASSSVLRPAARRGAHSDLGSSGTGSMRSSVSAATTTKGKGVDRKLSSLQSSSSYPQSLALSQDEEEYESGGGTPGGSSIGSPVHHVHSNKPSVPRGSQVTSVPPPRRPALVTQQQRPPVVPSTQLIPNKPPFQSATSYVRENRRASVVWDQDAGRYVSVASTTRPRSGGVDPPQLFAIPTGGGGGGTRASSSSALPPGQASERLAYTRQSIFFGGPRLGAAAAEPVGTGGERRRAAESFPVFAPGTLRTNPTPFNR